MEEILREKRRLEGLLSNIELEIYKVGRCWGAVCV
jgi:hypothetical protein